MPSATIEDYLKHIFLSEHKKPEQPVAMGKVASDLQVSPGTATTMVKSMADAGYLVYRPRVGVELTSRGRDYALKTLRRHRIIEVFLVEKLGLDWSEVHDEAEQLEHTISDKVLEALDAYLGFPTNDPHGAPIPTACGDYASESGLDLTDCAMHQDVEIQRIASEGPEFLQYLEEQGLLPGKRICITARSDAADAITLVLDKHTVTIGMSAGRKILVR